MERIYVFLQNELLKELDRDDAVILGVV